MGEFCDKYTNSTNISDILFFVYVKKFPHHTRKCGGFLEKMGEKNQIPALDQTLFIVCMGF